MYKVTCFTEWVIKIDQLGIDQKDILQLAALYNTLNHFAKRLESMMVTRKNAAL